MDAGAALEITPLGEPESITAIKLEEPYQREGEEHNFENCDDGEDDDYNPVEPEVLLANSPPSPADDDTDAHAELREQDVDKKSAKPEEEEILQHHSITSDITEEEINNFDEQNAVAVIGHNKNKKSGSGLAEPGIQILPEQFFHGLSEQSPSERPVKKVKKSQTKEGIYFQKNTLVPGGVLWEKKNKKK